MGDTYRETLKRRALEGDATAFDAWEREMFRLGTPAPRGEVVLSYHIDHLQRATQVLPQFRDLRSFALTVPEIAIARVDFEPLSSYPWDVTLEQAESESLIRLRRCL